MATPEEEAKRAEALRNLGLADLIDVPPPPQVEARAVEDVVVPIQQDAFEWRQEQDVTQRLVDQEYERLRKAELMSGPEAAEQAVALLEEQKGLPTERPMMDAGVLERAYAALIPRAVAMQPTLDIDPETVSTALLQTVVSAPQNPTSQIIQRQQQLMSGLEPTLLVRGESQMEWLLRVWGNGLEALYVELALQATGALPEAVQEQLPLPEADPVKRGYDVKAEHNFLQKYSYTVLDKIRHGRALEDDVWDATGHLPQRQRQALYVGVMAAGMMVNWEKPIMFAGRQAAQGVQLSRMFMAMEPNANMAKRVGSAMEAVMLAMRGRAADIPNIMRKRAATEIFNNEHKWSSNPEDLRNEMEVVAQAKYGMNVLDLMAEATPRNALLNDPAPTPPPEPRWFEDPTLPEGFIGPVRPHRKKPAQQAEPSPEAATDDDVIPPLDPIKEQTAEQKIAEQKVRDELDWRGSIDLKFKGYRPRATDKQVKQFVDDMRAERFDMANDLEAQRFRSGYREQIEQELSARRKSGEEGGPEAAPTSSERAWSEGVRREATDDEVQAFLDDPQITLDFLYRSDDVTDPLVDAWEFVLRRPELLNEPRIARRRGDMDDDGELAGKGSGEAAALAMQRILTPGREPEAAEAPTVVPPRRAKLRRLPEPEAEPAAPEPEVVAAQPDIYEVTDVIDEKQVAAAAEVPDSVSAYEYVQSVEELEAKLAKGEDIRLVLISDKNRNPNFYRIDTTQEKQHQYGRLPKTSKSPVSQRVRDALDKHLFVNEKWAENPTVTQRALDALFDAARLREGEKAAKQNTTYDTPLELVKSKLAKGYRFVQAVQPTPRTPEAAPRTPEAAPRPKQPFAPQPMRVPAGTRYKRTGLPPVAKADEAKPPPPSDTPAAKAKDKKPVDSPPTPAAAADDWLGAQPTMPFPKRKQVSQRQKIRDFFGKGYGPDPLYARTRVVDPVEAATELLDTMENAPDVLAQQLVDTAWEASTGHSTRYPFGLDMFMEEPNIEKYLDVYEEGVRRWMRKFAGGEKLVNIGNANMRASQGLWVSPARAKTIQSKLSSFFNKYNIEDAFDPRTETYQKWFADEFYAWVQDTTGKSPDVLVGAKQGEEFVQEVAAADRGPLTQEAMNDLIYQVKAHLAGTMAQARYAVQASSAGHRLIVDALNSTEKGSLVRQTFAKIANGLNQLIDLGTEDLPAPAQAVLEQVANTIRNNADLMLAKAKQTQKEQDVDALEAVFRVLDDEGIGRYSTVDAQLLQEIVSQNGMSIDSVMHALEKNRMRLPDALRERLEEAKKSWIDASQGFLSPGISRGLNAAEAAVKELADHLTSEMTESLLDVLEGAYYTKTRDDLKAHVLRMNDLDANWARKAWLEFFVQGDFGKAFDDLVANTPIGPRQDDKLAAGAKYAIKQRLRMIKEDALKELADVGLAFKVPPKDAKVPTPTVIAAAQDILNGKTDTLTWYNQREATMTPEVFAEAQRWLDQSGAWALQYADEFKEVDGYKVPNELARVLNEAARVGGRNPAELLRIVSNPFTDEGEKLRPVARIFSKIFNYYKMMMLGGLAVANTTYHVTNMLDIPFLMHRNLGAADTFGVFAAAAQHPDMVRRVTQSLTSWTDIIGDSNGLFRLALFDRQRYPVAKTGRAAEAYIRAPDGTVYTWDQLSRFAHENGLEATRSRTEIARNVIDDMRRRDSGTRASMAKGKLVAYQRGIQEISHTFEIAARVGVLVDGIKRGKTPVEALADARAAVLDYGRMTSTEQGFLRILVPFWAFNKANQMSFMRALINHPNRVRQQLQGIQATWELAGITEEERAYWSEYQTGRIALATLSEDGAVFRKDGTLDARHRVLGLFSPSMSTPQGLSMMFDIANLVATLVTLSPGGVVGEVGAKSESFASSLEDLSRNLNPAALLAGNMFKMYAGGEETGFGINPKLVVSPTMMSNVVFRDFIATHFPVRKVFYDEDNEKWLDANRYSKDANGLPAMYVVEGPVAQAAFVAFCDTFGRELARPASFLNWLGLWEDQMQYTRQDYMEPERGIDLRGLPGVQEELIESPLRRQQTTTERRLMELEGQIPPRSAIPN